MASNSYLKLTAKQRIYVDSRLAGLTKTASVAATGDKYPNKNIAVYDKNENVQAALIERMQATADEVDFGRKEAHEMLMRAYDTADTAGEQIQAVNALIKLHGLEKPKVIEHKHDHQHTHELEYMSNEKLMELADMSDLVLDGEFEVVDNNLPAIPPPTDENTVEALENDDRIDY